METVLCFANLLSTPGWVFAAPDCYRSGGNANCQHTPWGAIHGRMAHGASAEKWNVVDVGNSSAYGTIKGDVSVGKECSPRRSTIFRSGGERVSLGSIAGAKPKRKSDIGRKANSLSQHKPNKVFSTFHEHSHKPPVPKLPVASAERVRYELNRLGADDGR
jgi:hypothetical protein